MIDRGDARPLRYRRVTNAELRSKKLEDLRRDFARITGVPFRHFFCPILYRDDPGALCLGHIVNSSLTGSDKYRVIQRADVDCFYGSVCESAFVRALEGDLMASECPMTRAATVASILKAAHLTLFFLLGFRYAMSPGGWFLGHRVLGKFFRRNAGFRRRVAAANAVEHFAPYANLVRQVFPAPAGLGARFSPHDLAWCAVGRVPYAHVPLIPVRGCTYAVILPTLDSRASEVHFRDLLKSSAQTIEARPMRLRRDGWIFAGSEPIQLVPQLTVRPPNPPIA